MTKDKKKVAITIFLIFLSLISGLEINEGETLTLTCPRPSQRLPVVWQGPPSYREYTRGLSVALDLTADQRSRISLSGDHSNGYYNLQIENIQKADSGEYRCRIGSREIRSIKVIVKTQGKSLDGLFKFNFTNSNLLWSYIKTKAIYTLYSSAV